MKRITIVLLAPLSVAALCFAGTPTMYDKAPDYFPSALILMPGGKDVRYYESEGTFHLVYEIVCEYPATAALKRISDELLKNGWKPLKDDHLNPGLPSSHVIGWTEFGAEKPEWEVRQWLANWENEKGDVVTYGLRYEYEYRKTKNPKNLTVIAIFAPADIAKEEREWALEQMNRKKGLNK